MLNSLGNFFLQNIDIWKQIKPTECKIQKENSAIKSFWTDFISPLQQN
jgi:hypothetical protein